MIWAVATREIVTRGRSRPFVITTAILLVALIGGAIAVRLLVGGEDEAREVTIGVTASAELFVAALGVGDEDLAPTVVVTGNGRFDLEDGAIDVLFDGRTLTWVDAPDRTLDLYIREAMDLESLRARAADSGLSDRELAALLTPVELEEERLDGGEEETGVRLAAAAGSSVATFMLLQIWGSFVMMGVIEEKSSKVVEVLLAHLRPASLLAGKLLGLGILAVGQMVVVLVGAAIALALVRDITIPGEVWATLPLLLTVFVLGFAFYASAFAAVASTVSRQEDAVNAQLPAMLPLVASYLVAASSFGNPGNPAIVIGSFIPFGAPVLLPLRTAATDVPVWQIALSLLILAGSTVVMIRFAGRIYRYSVLHSGSRVPLKEAWANRNTIGL